MNPSTAALADQLPAVVAQFALAGRFREGAPHGNGHINDTFVARFDEAGASVRYIVQRINRRIFKNPAALMENVERVTAHAAARARTAHPADAARRALALVPTRAGRACTVDAQGEFWRCYRFVERTR
ncbi:MAG TPA: hypothetical protein VHE13_08010, partial [Opitutus sp.]|nr:hypothetical protein [Opitutus sp.]